MTTAFQRRRTARPVPDRIEGRALEHLRYIRHTMESTTAFTAVPGLGGVVMGAIALAAAALIELTPLGQRWLLVWLAAAAAAAVAGGAAMERKARRAGVKVYRGAGRRFLLNLSPPLIAAAVLTWALLARGATDLLPGLWMLLYGAGILTAGAFSVPIVPIMGACFMTAGLGALISPPAWGTAWMAFGFGGLHVLFGAIIARRHGG